MIFKVALKFFVDLIFNGYFLMMFRNSEWYDGEKVVEFRNYGSGEGLEIGTCRREGVEGKGGGLLEWVVEFRLIRVSRIGRGVMNLSLSSANFVFRCRYGTIYGFISNVGVRALLLYQEGKRKPYLLHEIPNIILGKVLTARLEWYFSGVREDFSDIPLDLSGASEFQVRIWDTLRKVPFGNTCTYGKLAVLAGFSPRYARAVGSAVRMNPIPIIIPCHRVVPSRGGLGNFSAGIEWKRNLLLVEGVRVES